MGAMAIPAAIMGGAGLLGTVVSSAGASAMNDRSLAFQAAQTKEGMDWQEKMYEKSHQDSLVDFENQSRFQQDLQKELMEYIYKSYNSPEQQVKALRAAGLNPAVLANGSSPFGNMSAPSSPTPAFAGGKQFSAPLASSPHLVNTMESAGQLLPSLASSLESLASANVQDAEANKTRNTLSIVIDKMLSDLNGQNLANAYQSAVNANYEAFGKKEWVAKINSLAAQAYMSVSQGDLNKAEKLATDALVTLRNQDIEFNSPKVAQAVTYWSNFLDEMRTNIELKRQQSLTQYSERAKNYASARESSASAESISYDTSFKRATEGGRLAMFQDELTNSFNSTFVSDAAKEQSIAAANLARYADDNKEAVFWKDYILSILGGTVDVLNSASTLGNMRAFRSLSDAQQQKVKAQVRNLDASTENIKVNSGDVSTISYTDKKGYRKTTTYKRKKRMYDY